jgi:hypothetical protein
METHGLFIKKLVSWSCFSLGFGFPAVEKACCSFGGCSIWMAETMRFSTRQVLEMFRLKRI